MVYTPTFHLGQCFLLTGARTNGKDTRSHLMSRGAGSSTVSQISLMNKIHKIRLRSILKEQMYNQKTNLLISLASLELYKLGLKFII
jgi:hypothetical protein